MPISTSGAGSDQVPHDSLPRHARTLRSHRVLRAIGMIVTAGLTFVAVGAAAVYIDLQSKITVDDVDDLIGEADRPTVAPPKDPDDPFAGQALNILVMGTDFRDAENAAIAGAVDGMRSDTTFLVHVSGDRKRMEVVSIPRDSLVDIPDCALPDGSRSYPQRNTIFNEAFSIGGGATEDMAYAAACTRRTVEQLTGVLTTGHVVVKMTGVIGVVDAIGGVRMCLPEPVRENPKYGDLDLAAGDQVLDGRTAIDFLRARHGSGLGLDVGSDLTRIKRQQAFLDSTVRTITAKNLLTSTPQLYGLVEAMLSSINTSPELGSPAALAGLGVSLRGIDPSQIVFTSVPVVDSTSQSGRVVWTADADAIWARIIADEPPPGSEDTETPDGGSTGTDGGTTGGGTTGGGTDSGTGGDTATGDTGTGGGTGAGTGGGTTGTDTPGTGTATSDTEEDVLPGVCAP